MDQVDYNVAGNIVICYNKPSLFYILRNTSRNPLGLKPSG